MDIKKITKFSIRLKLICHHAVILAVIPKTKALLIAGTGSGVGKTTVSMGLMATLGKRLKNWI